MITKSGVTVWREAAHGKGGGASGGTLRIREKQKRKEPHPQDEILKVR